MIRVRHLLLPPGLCAFIRRGSDGDLEVFVSDALEPERARAAVRMALRAIQPARHRAGLLPLPLVLLAAGSRRWLLGLLRLVRSHALVTAAAATAAAATAAVVVFALPHPAGPATAGGGSVPSQLQQPPLTAGAPPAVSHGSHAPAGSRSSGQHAPSVGPVAARSPSPGSTTPAPGSSGSGPAPQPSGSASTAPAGPTPSPTPTPSPSSSGGGGSGGGSGGAHCIVLLGIWICL